MGVGPRAAPGEGVSLPNSEICRKGPAGPRLNFKWHKIGFLMVNFDENWRNEKNDGAGAHGIGPGAGKKKHESCGKNMTPAKKS